MGTHHHPDAARDCEDRSEDQPRDHRLFDARKSKIGVMAESKHHRGEQDDQYFCAGAGPEKFAETLEQVPRKMVSSPKPAPTIIVKINPGSAARFPIRK